MSRKHIPMAIAYDFDGTLAPGNMQEHQFLPDVGMKPSKFWSEVKRQTKEEQADEILIYMNLMLQRAAQVGVPVRREDFKKRGQTIELFPGVEDWFERITRFGREQGVRIEHFIVSSGNAEIIAGTSIAKRFRQIYASKFRFDANGVAVWPALAVNYTTKTQYLFRINKDAHDLSDNERVNRFIEKEDRPVPFSNMIFIGDGSTDVPCFRLVREQGGLSIAVFKPQTRGARSKADSYLKDGRVHCVVPANYSPDSSLDRVVKANIAMIAARGALQDALAALTVS